MDHGTSVAARSRRGALDLRGQRFGELTADVQVAKTRRGALWSCRCDCGRLALRTAAYLRHAVKVGVAPSCRGCHVELRAGQRIDRRARIVETLSSGWERYGSLWSPWAEKRLTDEIRAAFAEEYGPAEEPARAEVDPTFFESDPGGIVHERRGGATLEEVGRELGCSRERARNIEQRALGKLRIALAKLERAPREGDGEGGEGSASAARPRPCAIPPGAGADPREIDAALARAQLAERVYGALSARDRSMARDAGYVLLSAEELAAARASGCVPPASYSYDPLDNRRLWCGWLRWTRWTPTGARPRLAPAPIPMIPMRVAPLPPVRPASPPRPTREQVEREAMKAASVRLRGYIYGYSAGAQPNTYYMGARVEGTFNVYLARWEVVAGQAMNTGELRASNGKPWRAADLDGQRDAVLVDMLRASPGMGAVPPEATAGLVDVMRAQSWWVVSATYVRNLIALHFLGPVAAGR